jgi:hypothetical protein
MRYGIAVMLCVLLAGCGASLKGRLETDVQSVNYDDGVNMHEATILAHHYRLDNLKWYALEEPVDDGDYWSFKLINGRTYEPADEPPLLIYKKAWSYKSAILVGKKPAKPPEPGKH